MSSPGMGFKAGDKESRVLKLRGWWPERVLKSELDSATVKETESPSM